MFEKFNNIKNTIKNKIDIKKEENNNLKKLLNTSTTMKELNPLPQQEPKLISEHIINNIITKSPDINTTKANIIANLIPIEETYLDIYYSKEILTNKEYFIIPTNYRIWIINTQEYKILSLNENRISIIKNNIMSKTILLNNVLLEINGNNQKIDKLINIIINPIERQNIITIETKYLCGITPIYQKINSINSGISLDKNNNLVIHNKENNYLYNINQITNYEILLDNQTYYSKNNQSKNTITNTFSACYQISIRITIQNEFQIILPILEPNNIRTKYQTQDTIFQTNLNFAKTIISKLEEVSQQKIQ